MTETPGTETDIAIVGGGTVGSLLAKGLLARTHCRVSLIDANSFSVDERHPGFDARVIALAKRTLDELEKLGVSLNVSHAAEITRIQVSEQGAAGLCQLDARQHGLPAFGRVVALTELGKAFRVESHPRLSIHAPASVTEVNRQQESVTVTLDNGHTLRARLLVLADGGRSELGNQLGLQHRSDDYNQTAIVANVRTSEPHNNWAYERFTPFGPLAFLPFNHGGVSESQSGSYGFAMVWTLPPEQAKRLLKCTDAEFVRQLQAAFGYRHGIIEGVGKRTHYPLVLRTADPAISHRVVTIGNAAQTLHPIAGQGFNLGLRDVIGLIDSLESEPDPGAFSVLHRFQQSRQGDRQATISLTDSLVRLFSNSHWPLQAARNIGLISMDNLSALKQRFVRQTTGFGPKA
ncbi:2-octaprenyl-6-methoxyphenyl hydroxylase [Alteromonas aestuariivivens]|uniref:2-octaprenyl-6-methoxyphenyl hydroxylase n=1 Tax=Alteromonas aestuariivivens TaxID=1938339 RepID=A0A3D8MEW5_9ALTE|nr:2-octaprenyl-6-methoxyphenyl hydroxylase [Alteromonas aestuariivivens]RDV29101.1 2-octaprenyl-6-methoxyphenyl hydroxylase [Alteromonas aestuariivivens]